MKCNRAVIFLMLVVSGGNSTHKQLIKCGYGMFIYFAVNAFTDLEWLDGAIPASAFNSSAIVNKKEYK